MFLSFVFILFVGCTSHEGAFKVTNISSEPIESLKITICNQTISYTNIMPSEEVKGMYKVKSDSHFTIEGLFKSGKKISKEAGYVTNGLDFNHEIIITDTEVKLSTLQKRK